MDEQAVPDEIEHFLFASFQIGVAVGVGVTEHLQHLGRGEIEDDEGRDGNRHVERIDPAEIALAHPAREQLVQRPAARGEVLADQPLHGLAAGRHQLMEQPGLAMPRADEVEMQVHVAQQDRPRRARGGEHVQHGAVEFLEMIFHDGFVEALFALKVIIEQGLVDAGGGGNGVRARPGQAGFREDTFGGGEDGRPRFIAAGLPMRWWTGVGCNN